MKHLSTFVVLITIFSIAKTQDDSSQDGRYEKLDNYQTTSPRELKDGSRRRVRKQSHHECREIFSGASGAFSSPDYPRRISDDLLCHWTVITPQHEVTLRFHFSKRNANLCPSTSQGWIFRDGTDPRGIKLQPQCQFRNPEVWGRTNAITIIFNSTFWESASGFKVFYDESRHEYNENEYLEWKYNEEEYNYEDESFAEAFSTNSPSPRISTAQPTTDVFDFQSSHDAYIGDGTTTIGPTTRDTLHTFSSTNSPSQGMTAIDQFRTDLPYSTRLESHVFDKVFLDGKERTYVGNEPIVSEEVTDELESAYLPCFYQETSSSGWISSPDYPNKVEGPICTWAITAFSTEVIEITFFDIDIEGKQENGACNKRFSHLTVTTFDENFNQFEHVYCHHISAPIQHISHENLWVDFRSNDGPSRFLSQYQSSTKVMTTIDAPVEASPDNGYHLLSPLCNLVLHDSVGVIQTPNFPNSYPQNVFCVWTILALPGRSISLRFRVFDIDGPVSGNGKCDISMIYKYSFVKLSYYSDEGTLIDETFCGSDVPGNIVSRSNRLSIYFQSGHGFGSGFEASYTSLSRHRMLPDSGGSFDNVPYETYCIILLNETSGYISYRDTIINELCTWVIQPTVEGTILLDVEYVQFTSQWDDLECDDVYTPVKIDTIEPTTFQPVTWGICQNSTRVRRFESFAQLNITFDSLDWTIVDFNAYYVVMTATDPIETTGIGGDVSMVEESLITSTDLPLLVTAFDLTEEPFCLETIQTSDGHITTPGFPNLPPEYRECSWDLVSSDISLFDIVFTDFHLGPQIAERCNENVNYLDIFVTNGSFANVPLSSDLVGRYCGTFISKRFHLTGRQVRLFLQINENGKGFRALFHREIYRPHGSTVYAPTEETIEITDFELDITLQTMVEEDDFEEDVRATTAQMTLSKEGVLLSEGDKEDVGKIPTSQTTILVDTTAKVRREEEMRKTTSLFITDTTEQTEIVTDLFQMEIAEDDVETRSDLDPTSLNTVTSLIKVGHAPCKFQIFDQMGRISSPNYPNPYPPNVHCIWLLQFESTQDVSIRFIEVDLPVTQTSSTHCVAQTGYIKITGWSSLKEELASIYVCGHSTQNNIQIRGRTVTFELLSNEMPNVHRGFSLVYITERYFYRGFFNGTFNASLFSFGSLLQESSTTTPTTPSTPTTPTIYGGAVQSDRRPIEILSSTIASSLSPTTNATEHDAGSTIDPRFRLTIFICTGVALVLLVILLVFLIVCVRNRSRSSALSLGPDPTAPGDYWSNYRQWARSDYPASIKYHYEGVGQPSLSGPGPFRVEQERLV